MFIFLCLSLITSAYYLDFSKVVLLCVHSRPVDANLTLTLDIVRESE